MDLWIRSQDKKRLIPNPNLYIVTTEEGYSYIGDTMVGHIGKYKNEKKALEVLDEIQKTLDDNVAKYDDDGYETLLENIKIYEMPKE